MQSRIYYYGDYVNKDTLPKNKMIRKYKCITGVWEGDSKSIVTGVCARWYKLHLFRNIGLIFIIPNFDNVHHVIRTQRRVLSRQTFLRGHSGRVDPSHISVVLKGRYVRIM